MRAIDATTARTNLRPTVEITRGPVRCSRSSAAVALTAAFTVGFAAAMLAVVILNLHLGLPTP